MVVNLRIGFSYIIYILCISVDITDVFERNKIAETRGVEKQQNINQQKGKINVVHD